MAAASHATAAITLESSDSVRTPRWVYRKGGRAARRKERGKAKEEGKAAGFTVHLATYRVPTSN